MDLNDLLPYITGVATALGGLFAIFKYGKKIFLKIKAPITRIAQTHEKIDKIFQEIGSNGGSSLKDKINSIDIEVKANSKELKINSEMTEIIYNQQTYILNKSDKALFRSNERGELVWVNKKYLELFGRTPEELRGFGWINIIHFDDRDKVEKDWGYSVKNQIAYESEYRAVAKNGIIYKVFCKAERMDNKKGYLGELEILNSSK